MVILQRTIPFIYRPMHVDASLNFIRLLRVVITPLVKSESTGCQCRPLTSPTQTTNQNHYPVFGLWRRHWTALPAGRFRRCWEEKTTRSNRMKFRLRGCKCICRIHEKTKLNSLEDITWSELEIKTRKLKCLLIINKWNSSILALRAALSSWV